MLTKSSRVRPREGLERGVAALNDGKRKMARNALLATLNL
jgi:hypothetical protein